MARYTSLYKSGNTPLQVLRKHLSDILRACNFDVIYEDSDYLCAKELPGEVNFSKLVTVEVLFDEPKAVTPVDSLKMSVVVKNEELPLQLNNHCREKFNRVNQVVSARQDIQLVESAA